MEALLLVVAFLVLLFGGRYLLSVLINVPTEATFNAISNARSARSRCKGAIATSGVSTATFSVLEQALFRNFGCLCEQTPDGLSTDIGGCAVSVAATADSIRVSAADPAIARRLVGVALAAVRTIDPTAQLSR